MITTTSIQSFLLLKSLYRKAKQSDNNVHGLLNFVTSPLLNSFHKIMCEREDLLSSLTKTTGLSLVSHKMNTSFSFITKHLIP